MKRLCGLLGVMATLPGVAQPVADTAITTTAPSLEAVTVEAPEPRYAARTQRDRIGRVWAPVLINGRGPFRLVLDTGANGSAVIASVAAELGISTATAAPVRLHGVTGSAMVPAIAVDRLEVGDLILEGKRLPVVPDVFGGAQGVLGTEGLADKRIHIDFGSDQISITRSRRQHARDGFNRIPLTLGRDRLPTLDIMIGSLRVKAILDTGAQQTIGNQALRDLVQRRRLGKKNALQPQDIMGVTLDVTQGEILPIPTLTIGSIEIRNLQLTIGDVFIFERWQLTRQPTVLIGMDIIGALDVLIIDYKKRELQIRARETGSCTTRTMEASRNRRGPVQRQRQC